jgi:DNA sulfur modification protein DndB
MGSTVYYQAVMRTEELAATVGAAMDFREFDQFLAHEKMQRTMNEARVEQSIVPYLVNSADRFFGSIIVLVYRPKEFIFESLGEIGGVTLPAAYRHLSSEVGSLIIDGGDLFALDGQHRLHALRTIVTRERTPHLDLPIVGPYKNAIKSDQLSVIFLPFDGAAKARRIFNKVNRYAKPTTTSTNILTSEDDGIYIITRCVASLDDPTGFDSDVEPPIPHKMSNGELATQLEGASMRANSRQLFTLELVSKAVDAICDATKQPPLDEPTTIVRPADDVLRAAYEECAGWWDALVGGFEPYRVALEDPASIPAMRGHDEVYSVAMRPNGQEALIRGLMDAHAMTGLSADELVERLNKVPLGFMHPMWDGILLGGGAHRIRVLGYSKLASELVTYLIVGAGAFGAARYKRLLSDYKAAKDMYGITVEKLPNPVV